MDITYEENNFGTYKPKLRITDINIEKSQNPGTVQMEVLGTYPSCYSLPLIGSDKKGDIYHMTLDTAPLYPGITCTSTKTFRAPITVGGFSGISGGEYGIALNGVVLGSFPSGSPLPSRNDGDLLLPEGFISEGIDLPETPDVLQQTPSPGVFAPQETLERGSEGTDVATLQRELAGKGYYDGRIDGRFGSGTEEALKRYQEENGLTADGKYGSNTHSLMYGATSTLTYTTRTTSSTGHFSSVLANPSTFIGTAEQVKARIVTAILLDAGFDSFLANTLTQQFLSR
jgi:hypothetical protein